MPKGSIVSANKQNVAGGSDVHTRSRFPLSYEFFDTHRFGEYHPHFWFDGVEGDKDVRLRSAHDVRSYTLKAPLLQDISMKKDYFMVPLEALLPLNHDKWNPIPVNGDDVSDDVGLGVADFWVLVNSIVLPRLSSISTVAGQSGSSAVQLVATIFNALIMGEYFYSSGSLMNSLGARGCRNYRITNSSTGVEYSYDEFFDLMVGVVAQNVKYFDAQVPGSSVTYRVILDGSPLLDVNSVTFIDLRTYLQMYRDNGQMVTVSGSVTLSSTLAAFKTAVSNFMSGLSVQISAQGDYNLQRVLSYQLVCAHFYSNDHVDYIYSANLYRQLIGNYVQNTVGFKTFVYNGLTYQYDYLSARYMTDIMTRIAGTGGVTPTSDDYAYIAAIFGYKRSLRYLDYFTGTRTQPLAVGDVNIDVQTQAGNSFVSAVDVTRNISRQRLFNAVNRVGAKWDNYIELMSGRKPAPDFHNPFYLGHTADVVYGSESEYTGNVSDSDVQNVTSVLRSNGGKFEFNVDFIDRPCLIIGITYYDLPRVYGRAFERQTFIMNRFDMFNKYMQFIGDQPVDKLELGAIDPSSSSGVVAGTFSYQNRDMQYKQRFNQLAGGFGVHSTQLDSWIYRADDVRIRSSVISPDFIRSMSTEFDKFYLSLTGYSLGTYFHFIVRNINDSSASRPMAYAPSIL